MITPQDRKEFAFLTRITVGVWLALCLVLLLTDWRFSLAFATGSILMSFIRGWSIASKTGLYVEDLTILLADDRVVERLIEAHSAKGVPVEPSQPK